jgi:hypothetical protein
MRNDILTADFKQSLQDYAYLLNREYPRKSMLKLIGDRYLLNTFQRILLNRGVFPDKNVQARKAKTTVDISKQEIHIDAYNVLFTLSNYLLGRLVFVGNDAFIRDAGEVYGKLHNDPVFEKATGLLFDYLAGMGPAKVEFYLDKPVSYSAQLAGTLRTMLMERGLSGGASLDKNPDATLIKMKTGIIASSDSDILDETDMPVTDLAHEILKVNFTLDLPDLGALLS